MNGSVEWKTRRRVGRLRARIAARRDACRVGGYALAARR
jgi:hypothetical protein